jgi:hypothetical protein
VRAESCIAMGLTESSTIPPTFANRKISVSGRTFDSSGLRFTDKMSEM